MAAVIPPTPAPAIAIFKAGMAAISPSFFVRTATYAARSQPVNAGGDGANALNWRGVLYPDGKKTAPISGAMG